jgi:hypothetical protein
LPTWTVHSVQPLRCAPLELAEDPDKGNLKFLSAYSLILLPLLISHNGVHQGYEYKEVPPSNNDTGTSCQAGSTYLPAPGLVSPPGASTTAASAGTTSSGWGSRSRKSW